MSKHQFDKSLLEDGKQPLTIGDLKALIANLPDDMPIIGADGDFCWFAGGLPRIVDVSEIHFEHPLAGPSLMMDYDKYKHTLNPHRVVHTFKALLD